MNSVKKWQGFTILELLIALLISLSIACFTITGLKKYEQRLEWQETLNRFEKKMMMWQNKAVHTHKVVKIKFIPSKHCFQTFLTGEKEKFDEFSLPKTISFNDGGGKEFQFTDEGNFSYLFKIHFYHSKLHQTQRYSLLIGGRLWKNHEK